MPKSVPLRAIATTSVEPGMSRAASSASLQAGIAEVEEEVVVAADEPQRLGDVGGVGAATSISAGQQVAQEHQRAGPVAVVALVAHLQHLGEDRRDVDRAGRRAPRCCSSGPEHVGHPAQPVEHLGAVGAVAQHLAEALVERAAGACRRCAGSSSTNIHIDGVTTPAIGPTARRWWHGLERDAVAGARAARSASSGSSARPSSSSAAHQRAAQRAGGAVPVDRRPGVQELPALEAERLARPGATSTSSAPAAEHPLERRARWRRRAAGRRRRVARSASVPGIGGRQSTRVTGDGLVGRARRRAGRRRR